MAATENEATNEQNSTSALAAHVDVDHAVLPDVAASQLPPYETSLERLLESLNAPEEVHRADRSVPLQDVSKMNHISASDRVDTGFALREAQGYQSRRLSRTEHIARESTREIDADDGPSSDQNASISRAYRSRPSECDQNSTRESATPITPTGARRFQIGYGKLLSFVIVSQVPIPVLLAFFANGYLGRSGLVITGSFVTLFVFVTLVSIVFGVRNWLKELRVRP